MKLLLLLLFITMHYGQDENLYDGNYKSKNIFFVINDGTIENLRIKEKIITQKIKCLFENFDGNSINIKLRFKKDDYTNEISFLCYFSNGKYVLSTGYYIISKYDDDGVEEIKHHEVIQLMYVPLSSK